MTNRQIRSLMIEAALAGDTMQMCVCRIALGEELALAMLDGMCLTDEEKTKLLALSEEDAKHWIEGALSAARSQEDE